MTSTTASKARLIADAASKIARTPELALQFSKAVFRRRVMLPIDYHFREGQSGPFDLIHIKLVNACNLRCKMCGQWGEQGYHFNQPAAYLKDLVPLDVLFKLIDDIAVHRPWLSISGGEAFLHPHALTLIGYAKKKGLTVTVSTNGLSLFEHGPNLVELGVDFMYVSIDGAREMHDDIRGLKGAFEKTIAGIKFVQAHKKTARKVKPFVLISAAVSHGNAARFDDIFEIAEDVQADGMVASFGWFQTEDSCRRHEDIMMEKLDTRPISHRGWLSFGAGLDVDALIASYNRIESKAWNFPYAWMPKLTVDEIPRYYTEHENTFGSTRCICPWSVVEILPNGDVATCVDLPDYIAGNIRNNGIMEIWNNERYKRFRSVVKDEGHLPACTRCSGLVGRGL